LYNKTKEDKMKLSKAQLKALKSAIKQVDDEEPGNDNKNAIRDLKRKSRREKNIQIKWNFSLGDFVSFTMNGQEEVGIIIEDHSTTSVRNKNHVKYAGKVLIMSSSGRQWVNPSKIEKIDED
jgi:hypothetical protein